MFLQKLPPIINRGDFMNSNANSSNTEITSEKEYLKSLLSQEAMWSMVPLVMAKGEESV